MAGSSQQLCPIPVAVATSPLHPLPLLHLSLNPAWGVGDVALLCRFIWSAAAACIVVADNVLVMKITKAEIHEKQCTYGNTKLHTHARMCADRCGETKTVQTVHAIIGSDTSMKTFAVKSIHCEPKTFPKLLAKVVCRYSSAVYRLWCTQQQNSSIGTQQIAKPPWSTCL